MCSEPVQSSAFLNARKRDKRARMKNLIELEVGLHCLKSRETSHGNKEVYLKTRCKNMVVSEVI